MLRVLSRSVQLSTPHEPPRRIGVGEAELLFHKVDAFTSPLTAFGDGSFWSFSAGAKIYFPPR
jgi:hypothetical protein